MEVKKANCRIKLRQLSSTRYIVLAQRWRSSEAFFINQDCKNPCNKLGLILLILVPRHPERFVRTTQLARIAGLRTELHSQGESCSAEAQCFVIDSMGELMTYYACADLAFVGGSIGEQGGHNALEPVALGKPVLMGPKMENAREIAAQLLECNAARCVDNQQDFVEEAEQILTDGALRDRMGQAGRELIESNKGALDLTLQAIKKLI